MIRTATLLLALLCVLAASGRAAAQEVRVRAGLDADEVLLGDAVGMTILVEGSDDVQGPALRSFGADIDATLDGAAPSRRTSIVVVNGERMRTEEVSYRLDFTLRPRRAGELRVPELTITAEGEEHTIAARTLTVIGPQPTDVASIELAVTPSRIYVEQPFELVLRVAIQAATLEGSTYDGDPWFGSRPPELRIPWFRDLEGFRGPDPQRFFGSLLAEFNESGFRINGLVQRAAFGEARALRFKLERTRELRNGRTFYVYELRKRLVPLAAGRVELPVSTLAGDLIQTLRPARGQLQAESTATVFVAHDPVAVEILPVPVDDAPPTYSHAVGTLRVSAEVQPRRVNVGDPMTLTLTVTGTGLIDHVAAPRIEEQPGLEDAFQVAVADPPRTDEMGRIFTYTLRPRTTDVSEVPAIELASFEPESERFVVARSEPIPIDVESAHSVAPSEVEMSAGGRPVESSPGDEIEGGLLGNYGDDETLQDEHFDPAGSPVTWVLLGLPPLALVGIMLLARRRDLHRADPAARRARSALPRALEHVGAARDALDRGAPRDAAAALHAALAGYVADRCRRPEGTLTALDVKAALADREIASGAAEEVVGTLESCEAARFGGAAADLPDRVDAAPGWLRSLDGERWS